MTLLTTNEETAGEQRGRSPLATALASLLDDTRVLSRRQWAELLHISESAISQWVGDKTLPRPEHLRKIVRFLQDSDDVPQAPGREFSRLSSLPARQVTPLGDRLGEDRTLDQYMLRPLRVALQISLSGLPAARQEEILLSANDAARRGLSGTANDSSNSASLLEAMESRAASVLAELGASSLCFYVSDPLFEGDFRLVLKPGVRYPEPLQGPRFPLKTKALSRFKDSQWFCRDAQSARPLREEGANDETRSLIMKNPLYGDFIEREGVKSCARLQHEQDDRLACVLFVNYSTHEEFDEPTKARIRSFFDELLEFQQDLTAVFRAEPWADELRILPIALQHFLAEHKDEGRNALKKGLEVIIERVLRAFGLDPQDTLGTIHVFDREKRVLRHAAQITQRPAQRELSVLQVNEGEGLVSWAALRRRAIMVNDLKTSPFRDIYRQLYEDTRSELVIPMFAGADLVAVLNLESVHRDAFSEQMIRPMAWAANQMAVVWQNFLLRKYDDMLEGLIDAVDRDSQRSLKQVAEVASSQLGFARCDIWSYDAARKEFTGVGANHPGVNPAAGPRIGGWSYHVVRQRRPVFICDIQSLRDFSAVEWNGRTWSRIEGAAPQEINEMSLALGVQAELGVPLLSEGRCVGVLWLKYEKAQRPPEPSLLQAIEVFARRASPIVLATAA